MKQKQFSIGKLVISYGDAPEPEPTVPAVQAGALMAVAGVDLKGLEAKCLNETQAANLDIEQAKADEAEAEADYLKTVSEARKKLEADEAEAEAKIKAANEAKIVPTLALEALEVMMTP